MFELVTMKDDVKIEPHNFGDAIETAVEKELNRKLANKVYHNHGLCIILYDILEIGDSLILPGDGAWEVFEISRTKFRLEIGPSLTSSGRKGHKIKQFACEGHFDMHKLMNKTFGEFLESSSMSRKRTNKTKMSQLRMFYS